MIERRRTGKQWLAGLALLLGLSYGAVDVEAQSSTTARVAGAIRGSDGRPVPQAIITMTATGGGREYQVTASTGGTFSIDLVWPGSYELRVEALGYRPLVARTLSLSGGDDRSVSFVLTAEPPPVTRVDTVIVAGSASSRVRAGGIVLDGRDAELPYRFTDMGAVAALSTSFDRGLGAQGLPGDLSVTIADGVPTYRAPHPSGRSELVANAVFPVSALSSVVAVHNPSDIEWSGAAGGYLVTTTRNSTRSGGIEFDGSWSGDPVWSSNELDVESPTLLSYQGGLRGAVDVGESGSFLLSGEVLRHEAPLVARVGSSLAPELSALDPTVLGGLTEPGTESFTRYSGLVRFDVQRSPTSSVFVRGAGAFTERSFDRAGPLTISGFSAPAEESVDFSAAAGVVTAPSRRLRLEFRGGLSGSYRDFGTAVDGRAPVFLAESGTILGEAPSSFGESGRTDFLLTPLVRYQATGDAAFKFGASLRASSHTMSHSRATLGDLVYSGASELIAGDGFGQITSAPEESFGTRELGVFGQYEGTPTPNVRLIVGGRYSYESIGGDGATLNDQWFEATGLRTNALETGFHQMDARVSLTWDPSSDGRTRLMLGGSVHEGDLDSRAIYEVFANDTEGTAARYSGTAPVWPGEWNPPLGSERPTLTLLGPDTRAPRTINVSASLSQRLTATTTAFAGVSTRRTDFLLRRRNLNIPRVPRALDAGGRSVFGTLIQTGGTVVTTSDDARRFPEFGAVWALDPDGWSEHLGITAGVEHSSSMVDLLGSYTWSETTDNWLGASSGTIGATLAPLVPVQEGSAPWSEGVSDFDRPHRLAGAATFRFGAVSVSTVYRLESGTPFTPRYRLGVDANGDGSMRNDVALVPSTEDLGSLAQDWPCLEDQAGGFAIRNSCRGPNRHSVDARIQFQIAVVGGQRARIVVDGLNLVESTDQVLDDALLLVDPDGRDLGGPRREYGDAPYDRERRFRSATLSDQSGPYGPVRCEDRRMNRAMFRELPTTGVAIVLLFSAAGLGCADAGDVALLEIEGSGVLVGQAYLDEDASGTFTAGDSPMAGC